MDLTARDRIEEIARNRPGDPALIGFDADLTPQRVSWLEFATEVGRISDAMQAQVGGDPQPPVIAVDAANTTASVLHIVATLCAGMTLLPLNAKAPKAERQRLLDLVAAEHGPVLGINDNLALYPRAEPARRSGAATDLGEHRHSSFLLPTGGSSGTIKVTAHPGPFGYNAARVPSPFLRQLGWRSGQRQLAVGPLHHAGPFLTLLDGVWDANTVILQPVFSPQWSIQLIQDQAVEWVQLTPSYMRAIVQLADPKPTSFATVRAVVHTAAACDDMTKRAWIDLVGPSRLYEYYGATEQVGVAAVRGDQWLIRPGTVGKGVFTQIRILDEAGRRMPPRAVGRVFMRSAHGYHSRHSAGEGHIESTVDGFKSVGDHGWLDEDGYLFLVPRRDDMINVGGENVYAAEVEAVLLEHPRVRDAVAVAMPDADLGCVVRVYATTQDGEAADIESLLIHCRRRLAGHKVPRRIDIVDEVPRSPAGKLERWRLSSTQPDAPTSPT